eukprot:99475_1
MYTKSNYTSCALIILVYFFMHFLYLLVNQDLLVNTNINPISITLTRMTTSYKNNNTHLLVNPNINTLKPAKTNNNSFLLNPISKCPLSSDTFRKQIQIQPHGNNFTHVMVPSFPSTGSTWFKLLLNTLSGMNTSENDRIENRITCDIYGESKVNLSTYQHEHLWCPGKNSGDVGAVTIKTHFPAQEQHSNKYPKFETSYQYPASTSFDKVILIVRDPITTRDSNNRRWGGRISVESIYCWAAWWNRVRLEMKKKK